MPIAIRNDLIIGAFATVTFLCASTAHAAFEYRVPVPGIKPVLASCSLPWGGTIASGSSVVAYQSETVVSGQSCVSESRTCSGEMLSGSYSNQKCSVVSPTLAASDVSTVSTRISDTSYTLSNTSGQPHPYGAGLGSILKGGMVTPECQGDFTFSFRAPAMMGGDQGYLGLTVVDSTYHNQVKAGYYTLVEQAHYFGMNLLRKMVNYSYTELAGSGPVNYSFSRVGNVLSATASSTNSMPVSDTYTLGTSTPLRAFVYFTKDAAGGAGATAATADITNVTFNCPGG